MAAVQQHITSRRGTRPKGKAACSTIGILVLALGCVILSVIVIEVRFMSGLKNDDDSRGEFGADAAAAAVLPPNAVPGSTNTTRSMSVSNDENPAEKAYDPLNCKKMVDGHCRDEDGGAWSYRKSDGTCVHTEQRVPRDRKMAFYLPQTFPDVKKGVLDFGGGVGAYLTFLRDEGVEDLVVMEPHPLGGCLFKGLKQDRTDLLNTPLTELPKEKYDMVMTIEVLEHMPVHYHPHIIDALTQATRKWLVFSAAHPGQPGEGHVGPSMKTREQWIEEITSRGQLVVDKEKMAALIKASMFSITKDNLIVFRRKTEN